MKRRAGVEAVIGHVKAEHRLSRNYLKGRDGDRTNAVLAAAGYNFSVLLRWLAAGEAFACPHPGPPPSATSRPNRLKNPLNHSSRPTLSNQFGGGSPCDGHVTQFYGLNLACDGCAGCAACLHDVKPQSHVAGRDCERRKRKIVAQRFLAAKHADGREAANQHAVRRGNSQARPARQRANEDPDPDRLSHGRPWQRQFHQAQRGFLHRCSASHWRRRRQL